MRVRGTPEVEQDRDEIWNHIAADNPSAAARMNLLFSEAAAKLAEFLMRSGVPNTPFLSGAGQPGC
ncbi:type II toxin-antitoxin system RelE/ParE family toxin [Luteimonas sp. R10]|uniref:type II toxin-antitoxin system RelE/ParE family toxin n=1 Tax=Luteimonas sp. R10 TaxID=3108176 RepID=UPI003090C51B|nr:type II toxin-antitoxin system RelE/ParE family toxin [Luteimonas sp. R10]